MSKSELTEEMKAVLGSMSGEEIERAIEMLGECREKAYEKKNMQLGMLSRLLSGTERKEEVLRIRKSGEQRDADLKVFGANVLSREEFRDLSKSDGRAVVLGCDHPWWLRDTARAVVNRGEAMMCFRLDHFARVRPVLIMEDASKAGLAIRDVFFVNDEKFAVITEQVAMRTACLMGDCTYTSDAYEDSLVCFIVQGWYERLLRRNSKSRAFAEAGPNAETA